MHNSPKKVTNMLTCIVFRNIYSNIDMNITIINMFISPKKVTNMFIHHILQYIYDTA